MFMYMQAGYICECAHMCAHVCVWSGSLSGIHKVMMQFLFLTAASAKY